VGDILKPSGTVRFINGSVYARVCVDPGVIDRLAAWLVRAFCSVVLVYVS